MRRLRARGYNLRYYAVIGTGQKAQQLVRDIEQMEWLGLKCALFVDNNADNIGTELLGIPVYGPVEKLTELAKTKAIDEVYLALSGNEAQKAYPILEALQSAGVTIRITPDWGNLALISGATAITIGSQILFSAADSPLKGVNVVFKEVFDRRRTLIGPWLRRTSLDELPQLINVVKGQMSLVGPRPERPVFAKQFSEEYKKYMLRHKVKAGMTGWAQINGFRGNTSLRKRLLYDLYYVRNWSWGLDMWILLRTPWHIIKGENAY